MLTECGECRRWSLTWQSCETGVSPRLNQKSQSAQPQACNLPKYVGRLHAMRGQWSSPITKTSRHRYGVGQPSSRGRGEGRSNRHAVGLPRTAQTEGGIRRASGLRSGPLPGRGHHRLRGPATCGLTKDALGRVVSAVSPSDFYRAPSNVSSFASPLRNRRYSSFFMAGLWLDMMRPASAAPFDSRSTTVPAIALAAVSTPSW